MNSLAKAFIATMGILSSLAALNLIFILPLKYHGDMYLFLAFALGYPSAIISSTCLKAVTENNFKGFLNNGWLSLNGWLSIIISCWLIAIPFLNKLDGEHQSTQRVIGSLFFAAVILVISLPACFNWKRLSPHSKLDMTIWLIVPILVWLIIRALSGR